MYQKKGYYNYFLKQNSSKIIEEVQLNLEDFTKEWKNFSQDKFYKDDEYTNFRYRFN